MSPVKALILDVDGVVSPVKGHTTWGDDVVAGWAFGEVPVSPTLCARLDQLATAPGLICRWLTSWTPAMRQHMNPFPGQDWPDIPEVPETEEWWKWTALDGWLRQHPGIERLVWCDDHLTAAMFDYHDAYDVDHGATTRRLVYHQWLTERGIDALLIAPHVDTGLTPEHMQKIEQVLGGRHSPEAGQGCRRGRRGLC